jgi:hypothetical protein
MGPERFGRPREGSGGSEAGAAAANGLPSAIGELKGRNRLAFVLADCRPLFSAQNSRNEARRDPDGTPVAFPEKKLAGARRHRPSLNREASRLGDVRIRRPSFRAQVPETRSGHRAPETVGKLSIAPDDLSRFTQIITNGNSVWLVCKNRNAVAGRQITRVNSPQPNFSSIGPRLLCAAENRETR